MKIRRENKQKTEGKTDMESVKNEETATETPVTPEEKETETQTAPEGVQATETQTPEEQLKQSQAKAEEFLGMAQRVQADFDNYRRRTQNQRAEAFEDGAREFIKTLLPVVDNLERALLADSSDESMKAGVDLVYKGLCDALIKRGVTVIDRKGEKFDPNLENAVMQASKEEGEPGTVCDVLQKGYQLGKQVIRHAMVKVVEE